MPGGRLRVRINGIENNHKIIFAHIRLFLCIKVILHLLDYFYGKITADHNNNKFHFYWENFFAANLNSPNISYGGNHPLQY